MNDKNKNEMPGVKMPPGIISYLAVAVVVWIIISSIGSLFMKSGSLREIKYNEFLDKLKAGEVAEVEIQTDRLIITPETEAAQTSAASETGAEDKNSGVKYYTGYLYDTELINLLNRYHVAFYTPVNNDNPFLAFFMTWIFPILVIYALFTFFINNVSKRFSGKGGFMSFGQSNAKIYVEK
ncbi:MAG: ATP-dependent metallopeptidase FtsH/Yme1/Tma family protein, partial [Clostridiales bacterium]|nr:ATP-dependent metallopeptidase FtsH/Yme1/Tma family protein [Clostridiales bacterium]